MGCAYWQMVDKLIQTVFWVAMVVVVIMILRFFNVI
jgi:hypothetical protein